MIIHRIAKEAVEFDKQGDYTKALTLYSVCTTLLSSEITVSLFYNHFINRHGIVVVMNQSRNT